MRLARANGLKPSANFALFRASLAVNTDGAPNSYHPDDFAGKHLAINRLDNAIGFYNPAGTQVYNSAANAIYQSWRGSSDWTVPKNVGRVVWQNVIAADASGKPCIFQSGPYKGYFGSLTALKNGLPLKDAGECQVLNQLDETEVPAIVLRGGSSNPLTTYGGQVGDLVLAINPRTHTAVAAVIGDSGNGDRIGEGSVALNMSLLGRTTQPRNYAEAKTLDTGSDSMVVAVLPGTRTFERTRPYSADNLAKRVTSWALGQGYVSIDALAAAAMQCSSGL